MTYNATTTATQLSSDFAPFITQKTILITGPSPSSIGFSFALAVSRASPGLIILAGRDTSKLTTTASAIHEANPSVMTRLLTVDLSSLASVRKAAAEVKGWDDVPAIDVVVNNAGIMAVPWGLSPDGVERQFATNHLGHFLLVNLLMDKVLKGSGGGTVVSVSSDGHRFGGVRLHDWNFDNGNTYNRWVAYGQSKTANILFTQSLAKKLGSKGLRAYSLHPGIIPTNLADHIDDMKGFVAELRNLDRALGNIEGWRSKVSYKTPDQGAATTVYAAFSPDLKDHNGVYLQDCHIADPRTETVKAWATSPIEAEMLWELSEKLVGQKFDYNS